MNYECYCDDFGGDGGAIWNNRVFSEFFSEFSQIRRLCHQTYLLRYFSFTLFLNVVENGEKLDKTEFPRSVSLVEKASALV